MSYPAISLTTATVGRHRCPQKRLQTARQPPVSPNRARTIASVTSSPPFQCPHAFHPCPPVDSGLDPDGVATAIAYQSRRRALSLVDCFALALAHHHGHTLLTEDRRMRAFAQDEGIPHHDLLWIIDHMHQAAILTTSQVVAALEAMHEDPRCPVPKQELARRLRSLNE